MMNSQECAVATRRIAYAERNGLASGILEVRVMLPQVVDADECSSVSPPSSYSCRVSFDAFPRLDYEVHGADAIQALELAVNIDPVLQSLQHKYVLSFLDGEPYFEG